MHLVYICRPGQNEELRFSLRSAAANLPVESVTIVGDAPRWVTGVRRIPGNRYSTKAKNVLDNVRIAVSAPGVPDDVVLMNDDFFVLNPTAQIPVLYRGSLRAHLERVASAWSWWAVSLQNTLSFLQQQGVDDPISYELHVPFPVNREGMRDALARLDDYCADNPPQWRTVYGNLARIGGASHTDAKWSLPVAGELEGQFLSTDDGAFYLGTMRQLRARFPDPSPFEAPERARRKEPTVALYKNVTTGMVVEDSSGRLDSVARWRRIADDELVSADEIVSDSPDGEPVEIVGEPVDDGADIAPAKVLDGDGEAAPAGEDGIPVLTDESGTPAKPKRTRAKKAE